MGMTTNHRKDNSITFRIPSDVKNDFIKYSQKKGISQSEIIDTYIRKLVGYEEKQQRLDLSMN